MSDRPQERGLSPVEALGRIDLILQDRRMSLAERVAAVGVALRANRRDGTSFPGYRFLCTRYGLGPSAVSKALAVPGGKAVGVHLKPTGRARKGVQVFKVLPPPSSESPESSASTTGALAGGLRSQKDPAALPVEGSSASSEAPQRFHHGSETKDELAQGTGGNWPPPPLSRTPATTEGNGDGHNETEGIQGDDTTDADPADPGAALRFSLGRDATTKERTAFDQAVREARKAGATDALIAHFVRKTPPGEGAWAGPNAAREETKRLVASWRSELEPPRETIGAILSDVIFCRQYLAGEVAGACEEGRARCRRVQAWAERNRDALRKAAEWPQEARP
jgi:hypothetical protein